MLMHIRRSGLILTISIILITGLVVSGWWIFVHTISVPQVSVEGGHLLDSSPGQISVRADTPQLSLSLGVPNGAILASQLLTIQNLASDRVELQALPPGTHIVHRAATFLQLRLPSLSAGVHHLSLSTQPIDENKVTIAVFGDSQGFNEALATIVEDVNLREVDFAVHLGDITPSGEFSQYAAVAAVLEELQVPLYATPGNHDVKGNGTTHYTRYFGPQNLAFTYNDMCFISVDSSSLGVNATLFNWLERELQQADTRPIIVYTHVPAVDPRPSNDHGFLDGQEADAFLALMTQYQVTLVMNGHIHLFNTTVHEEIPYLISGGAGAALVAPASQGGFHHYVLVTIATEEVTLSPQPVEVPLLPVAVELRNAANFSMILGLHDLESLASIERFGQFENQYGNLHGYGVYRGVLVSDLLDLVGGINSNQGLVVKAVDEYQQSYGYANVYPNSSWYQLQGDFILAFQYNTSLPPNWTDGPRLAFLPADETYSNDDCTATSYPGQGCELYPSAGARWVRNVILLQLINSP